MPIDPDKSVPLYTILDESDCGDTTMEVESHPSPKLSRCTTLQRLVPSGQVGLGLLLFVELVPDDDDPFLHSYDKKELHSVELGLRQ